MKKEIEIKSSEIGRFISSKKDILSEFKLDFDKLFSLKTDFTELDELIKEQEALLSNTKLSVIGIEPEEKDKLSLNRLVAIKKENLVKEQGKLDSEQKKYQDYLNDKKTWEDERKKIIGNETSPLTITGLKKELHYLNSFCSKYAGF